MKFLISLSICIFAYSILHFFLNLHICIFNFSLFYQFAFLFHHYFINWIARLVVKPNRLLYQVLEGSHSVFYVQCQRLANNEFMETLLCCPNKTAWHQEYLNCVWDISCDDSYWNCPTYPPSGTLLKLHYIIANILLNFI